MDFTEAYNVDHLHFLAKGLLNTLEISISTVFFSLLLGSILGFIRYANVPILSKIIKLYIESMRNLPPILIIFFTFFGLANIGINLPVKTAAIAALTAYGTSLIAEIVRSGLLSISRGQIEAARAQGFTYLQTIGYIIFPQAVKIMIPPLVGQVIILVKNSSLSLVIGLEELTKSGQLIYSSNFRLVIPILMLVALIYFVINFSLSVLSRSLEKRLTT